MEKRIFNGLITLSLITIVYSAPQLPIYQQSPGNSPVSNVDKPSVYKNNSRDSQNGTSELFGYPEDPSAIESKQNARNRTPVYIPNRCQKNEILYPGDQESDWVCDCKPTYVYHPPTRQCYQLFTQAYCDERYMVTLEPDAKHPQCVVNDCYKRNENLVPFGNECVQLNAYHKNCSHHQLKQIVSVREEDNKLGCINISDVLDKRPMPSTMELDRTASVIRGGAPQRYRRQ